jgi:folylpolyglutamate synthase/dihydropteroate synthase
VSSGIKLAIKAATKQEEILVTGSFSVVAEAREYILGINPELYTNIRIVEKPGI